jgi:hypothetical protein
MTGTPFFVFFNGLAYTLFGRIGNTGNSLEAVLIIGRRTQTIIGPGNLLLTPA